VEKKAMFGRKIENLTKVVFVGSMLFGVFFLNVRAQENIQFSQGKVEEGMNNSINIPLMSYKGRGISLPIALSYSSNVWRIDHINTVVNYGQQSMTQTIYSEYATSGWKTSLDIPVIEFPKYTDAYWSTGGAYCPVCNGSGNAYRVSKLTVHMPDGSTHELRESDTPSNSGSVDVSGTFYAVDGSRLRYDSTDADTGTLYVPDGTRYVLDAGSAQWIDRHGNTLTYSGTNRQWTDTLGRVIDMPFPASPTAQDYTYELPGLDGVNDGVQVYTFKWRELEDVLTPDANNNTPDLRVMASHYLPYPSSDPTNPSGNNYPQEQSSQYQSLFTSEYPGEGSVVKTMVVGKAQTASQLFNPVVLAEIVLPDGSKYKFSYNVYGEIDKIVYPTGAYETYQMQKITGSYNLSEPYDQANRGVTSRKLSENGTGNDILEWKYSKQEVGTGSWGTGTEGAFVYRVIAPDNTRTEVYKLKLPVPMHGTQYHEYWAWGFTDPREGATAERRVYSTSSDGLGGTLLRREMISYERTANYVTTIPANDVIYAYRNIRPVKEVSIVFEGSGPALAQTKTYTYDTTYEMSTGLDQITTSVYHYVVVSNNSSSDTAQAGTISQISSGNLAKSTETTFLNSSTYRDANILGLPTVSRIYDSSGSNIVSQTEMVYDESAYSPAVGRALPTSVKTWDSAKGTDRSNSNNYIVTKTKYDTYGNAIEATDAKDYVTTITYDSTYHTYPVSITTPVPDDSGTYGSSTALTVSTTFDPVTGLTLSTIDVNGQSTAFEYEDTLLRPTKTTAPNGQQTIIEYGVPNSSGVIISAERFVRVKVQIDDSKWSETYTWTDGLGRKIKTQKIDSNGDVLAETEYDNMGRVKKVSNPYRTGDTALKTENFYDDLGRLTKVKTPDNAEVETSYALATSGSQIGTMITVEDQADQLKRSISNAMGQLIRIDEPTDSGGLGTVSSPNQATIYAYNTLNNLTTVTQGSQTRTFTYSSLSRLLSSANPESGTVTYTYDDNSNMLTKTDARGVVTTFTFDRLNRLKTRGYSGESSYTTPTVSHYYDNLTNAKGKQIKVSSSISTTEYTAWDIMGRPTSHKQAIDGTDYTTTYTYNLRGDLVEETLPSTRKIKTVLDNDGSISSVQSKKNLTSGYWNYADNFTYNAAGTIKKMQLGNGHWESALFNNRLQPTQMALGTTPDATNLLKLEYAYGKWESGSLNTAKNNGNIGQQIITAPNGGSNLVFTQKYDYDSLNRITDATETGSGGQTWRQVFTYDRYGNRNFDETNTTTLTKSCGSSPNFTVCTADRKVQNPSISTSTNRIVQDQDGDSVNDYSFDSSGSTTKLATGLTFIYDGENKQVEVKNSSNQTIGQYWYDGDGKRVKKYVPGTGETTIFVYDASGIMVAEYSTVLNPTPQVSYLTNDNLGSPRINTNESGAVISRHDYHPFGEEIMTSQRTSGLGYVADDNRKQFTGYERDNETGLDFAQARMYRGQLGRFTTADPLISSARVTVAQSWNRFTYVLNCPLRLTDPTGMFDSGDSLGGSATDDELKKTKDGQKIFEKRQEFIKKLNSLKSLDWETAKKMGLTADQFGKMQKAVAAFGNPEDKNGVKVELGEVKQGTGDTRAGRNPDGSPKFFNVKTNEKGEVTSVQANVVVTLEAFTLSDIIHEGDHVAARQDLARETASQWTAGNMDFDYLNSQLNRTQYSMENGGYHAGSFYDQYTGTNTDIWKKGWSEVERQTAIDKRIAKEYKDSNNRPITPANQGNRIGRQ
jgi:RHS repeat-associated protein